MGSFVHFACAMIGAAWETCFPHSSFISNMKPLSDKLPVVQRYILPQRFVTSSLIQPLKKVDSMCPGVEVEISTSTNYVEGELRLDMQNVRVLALLICPLNSAVFTGAF